MTLDAPICSACRGEKVRLDAPWIVCPTCYGNGVEYFTHVEPVMEREMMDEPPSREIPEKKGGSA